MTYLCPKCGAKYDAQPIYCKCGWPTLTEVNGPDVGADGDGNGSGSGYGWGGGRGVGE